MVGVCRYRDFERRSPGSLGPWIQGIFLIGVLLVVTQTSGAAAAERSFMGFTIAPLSGTYEVVKDANVRSEPRTQGKRLTGVNAGTQVEAVGKEGSWIAIRRAGKDLGFIYEPLIKAISLPPLKRDSEGRIVDDKDEPVAPAEGFYVTRADVNVRFGPSTKARKRSDLDRGVKVEAIGSAADGKWLVVRQDDQELGFVFTETLLPLIDGSLGQPVKGQTALGAGDSCQFAIRFIGKNPVERELFETSDYEVDWSCSVKGRTVSFPGYMFITEAPFQLSDNNVYQITVDLLDVSREYDEIFSTVFLYRRSENKVVFDSVSMKDFAKTPDPTELPAGDVVAALTSAAQIAPNVWNSRVWERLSEGSF